MNQNDILTHVMQVYQSHGEPERLYAIAGKYWRIMLSTGIFIGLCAIVGGGYMLLASFWAMTATNSQTGSVQTINRPELTRVVNAFGDRQSLFQKIQSSTSTIPDPSR